MTLAEAIGMIEELDEGMLLCARRPWSRQAPCEFVTPTEELGVPIDARERGLEYFMSVATALEALEVFGERVPTPDEKFDLLLFYAEHDAFPEWVFG